MPTPQTIELDPIRKAAILISTLDHRVADELLERMSDEQAALVRQAAMELDNIPEREQQLVMQEFLGTDDPVAAPDDDGIELDEQLARKLAASERFDEPSVTSGESEEAPFRFLCDAEVDAIARHLEHENPQITALVIAHLPPRHAANLLKHFDPPLQASLLRRIAELDTADRDVIREVEKHLKSLLHEDLRAAKNRVIGLSTVASILTAAGETRTELISSLTHHDRQLAQQLRQSKSPLLQPAGQHAERSAPAQQERRLESSGAMHVEPAASERTGATAWRPHTHQGVTFEELAQFRAADLAAVFRESESKLALLALAGATPAFVDRLLKYLPARDAGAMRRAMQRLGPLRLKDIERAQQAIAEIANELIAAGVIALPQAKPFAVAA